MAVVLALGIAIPAFGGPSVLKRVKKLERRANATARLASHANHRELRVLNSSAPMSYMGNGVWSGTANCVGEGEVTGGGASSSGARYLTDNIIQSYPTNTGWFVELHSGVPNPTLRVYAVCTHVSP